MDSEPFALQLVCPCHAVNVGSVYYNKCIIVLLYKLLCIYIHTVKHPELSSQHVQMSSTYRPAIIMPATRRPIRPSINLNK